MKDRVLVTVTDKYIHVYGPYTLSRARAEQRKERADGVRAAVCKVIDIDGMNEAARRRESA